jgi:hypothetical protein
VNIEEPIADQIEDDVEVLEVPSGDGVWHIKRCHAMFHHVSHCKNPPNIIVI